MSARQEIRSKTVPNALLERVARRTLVSSSRASKLSPRASRGVSGRSWDALGVLLGRSWSALGVLLGALGTLLGSLGTLLGPPGRSWLVFATSGSRFCNQKNKNMRNALKECNNVLE